MSKFARHRAHELPQVQPSPVGMKEKIQPQRQPQERVAEREVEARRYLHAGTWLDMRGNLHWPPKHVPALRASGGRR